MRPSSSAGSFTDGRSKRGGETAPWSRCRGLRAAAVEVIATRRWVEQDEAAEGGAASMADRAMAEGVLLSLLDPETVELEDHDDRV